MKQPKLTMRVMIFDDYLQGNATSFNCIHLGKTNISHHHAWQMSIFIVNTNSKQKYSSQDHPQSLRIKQKIIEKNRNKFGPLSFKLSTKFSSYPILNFFQIGPLNFKLSTRLVLYCIFVCPTKRSSNVPITCDATSAPCYSHVISISLSMTKLVDSLKNKKPNWKKKWKMRD